MRDEFNVSYSKKEDIVYAMKNENMLPRDWRTDFRKTHLTTNPSQSPFTPAGVNQTFDLGVPRATNLHALNPPTKHSIDVKTKGL
jgi:hypothetical protein